MMQTKPFNFKLATCSYKGFKPEMGVPVRITVGAYRWWQGPKLLYVAELAPWGIFGKPEFNGHPEAFEKAYRERLDTNREVIEAKLTALSDEGHVRLVLLCYEDVYQPGLYCHRTWAANWLHETFGVDVPEVSEHLNR